MANFLGDYGGYPANDPRNQVGRGIITKGVNRLVSLAESGATPIASLDTERNIISPRPFIDRSESTPKTQIFGAIKDRLHNFFQPGDPAYNYDDTPVTAVPTALVNRTAAATQPGVTPGNVGLKKLGPQDLTRLSDGTLPGKSARRPTRKATAIATPAVYSQPDEEGLRTTEGIAAPMLPAGQRIFEMSGADAAGMKDAEIVGNGGFATQDGRTFVLPSRSTQEEQQFQTQLAQQNAAPIAAVAPQVSTVGTAKGVFNVAQGESLPPEAYDMSLGDMAVAKFNTNQQVKRAGIANVNSEIANRSALLPSQIKQNEASAYHSIAGADVSKFLAPSQARQNDSSAFHNEASALIASYLAPSQREQNMASADSSRASAETSRFLSPTIATKNLADAAESSAKLKQLLNPAKMSGMTAKEQVDVIHKGSLDAALEMMKQSTATDPTERQKEFEKNYYGNVKRAATLLKSFQGA